jgi:hypothetical protein
MNQTARSLPAHVGWVLSNHMHLTTATVQRVLPAIVTGLQMKTSARKLHVFWPTMTMMMVAMVPLLCLHPDYLPKKKEKTEPGQ